MSWAHLYAYIISVAPDLVADLVGVPEEHIVACEHGLNLRLPPAYRGLLLTMGVDAGRFYPLGGTMEWNFYELLRDPPDEYVPQDLFRVATEPDDGLIIHNDLYLDMQTVNQQGDCDLLMIEYAMPPRREDAFSRRQTLLERITQVAWQTLDAARFAHNRPVYILPEGPGELAERKATVLEILKHAGFHHTLPDLHRVDCLAVNGEQTGTAHIGQGERLLSTYVASDDEATVSRIIQLILDNVKDAYL